MHAKQVRDADGANWKRTGNMLMLQVLMVMSPKSDRPVVLAKFYKSSMGASVVHCNVWTPNGGGYGNAGGGGYHKASAALEEAIKSAGYDLFGDVYGRENHRRPAYIGGVGTRAMELAMLAVAATENPRARFVIGVDA